MRRPFASNARAEPEKAAPATICPSPGGISQAPANALGSGASKAAARHKDMQNTHRIRNETPPTSRRGDGGRLPVHETYYQRSRHTSAALCGREFRESMNGY